MKKIKFTREDERYIVESLGYNWGTIEAEDFWTENTLGDSWLHCISIGSRQIFFDLHFPYKHYFPLDRDRLNVISRAVKLKERS